MKKILKSIKEFAESYPFAHVLSFVFNAFEKLTNYLVLRTLFLKRLGYKLNLKDPKTCNEKINWLKIHYKNDLLVKLSDKYAVREYIKEKLGEKEASEILIPLLHVTDDPNDIPFDDFKNGYVVKATNGSGTNFLVKKDEKVDHQEIITQCKKWLKLSYGILKHEWQYSKIKTKIIVESLITDSDGKIPKDYKFFMFNGKCRAGFRTS